MAADRRLDQSNGTPKEPAREADDQTNENIFLFVPNLIGKSIGQAPSQGAPRN